MTITHRIFYKGCLADLGNNSIINLKDLCETKGPVDCCPGWNLGGYVALISNRSSCFAVTVRGRRWWP